MSIDNLSPNTKEGERKRERGKETDVERDRKRKGKREEERAREGGRQREGERWRCKIIWNRQKHIQKQKILVTRLNSSFNVPFLENCKFVE